MTSGGQMPDLPWNVMPFRSCHALLSIMFFWTPFRHSPADLLFVEDAEAFDDGSSF